MLDWLPRSALIARITFVRQLRKARDKPWMAFFQVFTIVFGVLIVVGRLPIPGYRSVMTQSGAYVLGRRLAAGEAAGVLATVRGFAGVLLVLLVFLTVIKEATQGAMESHVDSLLVATDARTVTVGGIGASVLFTGWQFGTLIVAGGIAFAVGAGSPLVALTATVAGAGLLVTAVTLGFGLAIAIRLAFQRVPVLRENRILVGGPIAVAYFALFGQIRESMTVLADLPVGWYGDAGLLTAAGVGADPVRAVAALASVPVVVVGTAAATVPLAARLWYGDELQDEHDEAGAEASAGTTVGQRLLEAVAARPTAAVAYVVWIRIRREPRSLLFTAFPIGIAAAVLVEFVASQPRVAPAVVAVYVSAAFGMGATLNPLGNAGACLPATLTTPDGGRHLVRGYVLSAALPGVPAVVVATLFAGAVVGVSPLVVAWTAGVGGALALAAAAISLGVGVALPNMEGIRPTGSGIRPPQLWATTVFLVLVALVGSPTIAAVGYAPQVAGDAGVSPLAVLAAGSATTLGIAAVAGWVAYRRSTDAIANYAIE